MWIVIPVNLNWYAAVDHLLMLAHTLTALARGVVGDMHRQWL